MTLSPRINPLVPASPPDRGRLAAAGTLPTVSQLLRTIAAQAVAEAEHRQARDDLAAQLQHLGPSVAVAEIEAHGQTRH